MKTAFFDLSGTIIHHKTGRPLPLMEEILRYHRENGWMVVIASSYPQADATALLLAARIQPPSVILSSSKSNPKGEVIKRYLDQHDSKEESFFVDDKPGNLDSVKKICGDRVRVIGFVGSRKYTDKKHNEQPIAQWCAKNKTELALSAADLCESLTGSGGLDNAIDERLLYWGETEIMNLLPGSSHSVHRSIFSFFSEHPIHDFDCFWRNLAWVCCPEHSAECLVQAFASSVLKYLAVELPPELVNFFSWKKHATALESFIKQNPHSGLRTAFDRACEALDCGISKIGVEAEYCRIDHRYMNRRRIWLAKERLGKAIGILR